MRLLENVEAHFKPILITAYNTGMRRGEILNLKWSNIDRANRFIRLPADATKEGKPKNIPINRNVQEVLGTLPRHVHYDFVFTRAGKPLGTIVKSLRTACEKSGVVYGMNKENGFRFHDIRATVKTNMVKAGVEASLRNAILGHTQGGMDRFYLRFSDEDLRTAMDQYAAWLDKQDAGAFANVTQTVPQADV